MAFRDLRDYITLLREEGELVEVRQEVDWKGEVGAISRKAIDCRTGAPLFHNVKGYAGKGVLLANPIGPSRTSLHKKVALALNLPGDAEATFLIKQFQALVEKRLPPVVVETGHCKENVLKGNDINVMEFPIPLVHDPDGGRYAGTWHIDVTKDPDSGWVNWGMYRHMVHDGKTLGYLAEPAQHAAQMYYQKFEPRGVPMPMAVVIGTEPLMNIIAGSQLPPGVNEVDVVGGIRGEPVELVKCETIDLEVPAAAEIVLEGLVEPGERRPEGPFGEFTGYVGGRHEQPVFHITCITYRDNPVVTMSNMGKPWDDYAVFSSITMSALAANELQKKGIPFKGVYVPPPCLGFIVSVHKAYPGFPFTVASALWSSKVGVYRPYVFVVGDDVDITNMDDFFWCLTTRLHPKYGVHRVDGTPAMPLLPFLRPEERDSLVTSRVLFDATFPAEWKEEAVPQIVDFQHSWNRELRELVERRWRDYGFPEG